MGRGGWGHEAQIDVRSLKMKIAAQDKREGGTRRGEENRGKGGKLICLGDGTSQGRERVNKLGGRVKRR